MKIFKKTIDWEKEFDVLYLYTQRLEQQLIVSTELTKKALDLIDKLENKK